MGIHMIKGEKIQWTSHAGKNYRMFILFRDLIVCFFITWLVHFFLTDFDVPFLHEVKAWKVAGFFFLVGLGFSAIHQFTFIFTKYFLTNERIIIEKGFISRKLTSIKYENIHDMKVIQSIPERLLRIGNIYIFTSNDSNPKENDPNPLTMVPCLEKIDFPYKLHGLIEENIELNLHGKE